MTLIEGFGDEVVHFAAIVVVVVVAVVSWWSTNARPVRYRAVLLARAHARRSVRLSIRPGVPPTAMLHTNRPPNSSGQASTETVTVSSAAGAVESRPLINSDNVVPLQEMDSIVDADMALLDNSRLRFYRRVAEPSPRVAQVATETAANEAESQEAVEPASNEQIREMDSIVSAMEADESTNCDVFSRPNANDSNSTTLKSKMKKEKKKDDQESATPTAPENGTDSNAEGDQTNTNSTVRNVQANESKILIKLKYLNDTLKEVDGSLDELLKDFKWRHFSNELMSEFRVRLIFNGRVLCDEGATLRALGLHHRAVVHCLVHPRRVPTSDGTGAEETANGALEGGAPRAPERAWDLENILMTLVSVALTIVWFFRCEYSNLFTASASVALFGLTVFYSVAIFGLYLSDTFHFDRRQPQPVPNN